jgi:hypothetical protein
MAKFTSKITPTNKIENVAFKNIIVLDISTIIKNLPSFHICMVPKIAKMVKSSYG